MYVYIYLHGIFVDPFTSNLALSCRVYLLFGFFFPLGNLTSNMFVCNEITYQISLNLCVLFGFSCLITCSPNHPFLFSNLFIAFYFSLVCVCICLWMECHNGCYRTSEENLAGVLPVLGIEPQSSGLVAGIAPFLCFFLITLLLLLQTWSVIILAFTI